MMMSVSERIQEIGILLSIGTEKGEVRRMFIYEAFILGILGAVIGGVGSLVIGYTVVSVMIGTTAYFFRAGKYPVCPGSHAYRRGCLCYIRGISGMESLEHGPD